MTADLRTATYRGPGHHPISCDPRPRPRSPPRDDLTAIPTVIALSRRARRIVVTNLVIAPTFIGALVACDLIDTPPLPLGVAGHEGSTIIVWLTGLGLLGAAAWRRAARAQP